MTFFLDFDPYSFFNIVKKLFLEHAPYEFIKSQASFIEMFKDQVVGLEACMSHEEIIICLDAAVKTYLHSDRDSNDGNLSSKGEALQNAFIFFVAAVSKKIKIHISLDLCERTISQQIAFYKKLLSLPKEEIKRVIPETESSRKTKDRTSNIYTYLIKKNERELLGLVKR